MNIPNSYCLVLGGGGARGAYEVGVWKALREMDISFHATAGTSVGALNAAFVAQNDYAAAEDLFSGISIDKVVEIPEKFLQDGIINRDLKNLHNLSRYLLSHRGLDTAPLHSLIDHYLHEDKIRKSGIDLGLVTYDLSNFKPLRVFLEDIPAGQLADYLLASASHPLFKTTKIDETRLTDGGVSDNIPFNMMKQRGYRRIIAVDLSGMGRTRKPQTENTQTIYIKNSQKLDGVMEFTPENSRRSMHLGYLDTLRVFEQTEGIRYFIKNDLRLFRKIEERLADPKLLPLIRSATDGLRHPVTAQQTEGQKSTGPAMIRQILPKENAKYRFIAIPLIESAASCLDIPRSPLYSLEELLDLIRKGMQAVAADPPLSGRDDLKGVIKRLSRELETLNKDGFFQLSPARYASALRTVMGKDDQNLSIKMLQPLFPELPAANLLHILITERASFFY